MHPPSARRRGSTAAIESPTLTQFVVLSLLVHVLVIMLFGTQSGGGGRRSEEWWGPLDVNLRQLIPDQGSGLSRDRGEAKARSRARLPSRPPAAAAEPSGGPASGEAPPVLEAAPPGETPPPEALPQLRPDALEELDQRFAPTPLLAPTIRRPLAPPPELPSREMPRGPAAPIEPIAPPRIKREIAPPAALPPRQAPLAPAAPIEPIVPPRVEQEITPPAALPPRQAPLAPAAPIEPIVAPRIEREVAPSAALPSRQAPLAPAAAIEPIAPRQLGPLPGGAPGQALPRAARPPAPAVQPAPRAEPPTVEPLPRLRLGAPVPDESMFRPRVVTPPTEPGGSPHVDIEATRQSAREIAAKGLESRAVFTLPIPPVPERETKEAIAIKKATKQDCRTAYAEMGLLAAPALLAGAISDDAGCKW